MNAKLFAAAAALVSVAATASPAAAWDIIGMREVADRTDHDIMAIEGHRKFTRIKVCVYRKPVHFYDVDINFENGGHQDVSVRQRINAGQCTRVIDLEGGARDIETIKFLYEETSFKRRKAIMKVFAE